MIGIAGGWPPSIVGYGPYRRETPMKEHNTQDLTAPRREITVKIIITGSDGTTELANVEGAYPAPVAPEKMDTALQDLSAQALDAYTAAIS